MKKNLFQIFFILLTFSVLAQNRSISGSVKDATDGTGLAGVNVVLKNSKTATTTDTEGNFKLNLPTEGVLIFTYIGYKTQELATNEKNDFQISMQEDAKTLKDVVVTGYANQNKRESSGSVSVLKSDKLRQVPMASFDQMMQGQAPGLLVVASSGQPGQSALVRLRGVGSINGSNAPLYILDGIQITAANFTTLNAEDFESISILKDASATSIYGSRGANGVIVITSKKGKAGGLKVEYGGLYGTSDYPQNPIKVMTTNEKIDYELARGGTPLSKLSKEDIEKLRQTNTNWEKFIFQKGTTQQHQLALSGGSENLTFYLAANHFDQTGTVQGTGVQRNTARLNVEGKQGDFSYGANTSVGFSKYNYVDESDRNLSSPLNGLRWANSYEKPYNDDGTYSILKSGFPNPVREIKERSKNIDELKAVANVYLQYALSFVKGLSLRTNWGTDYQNWDVTTYFSKLSSGGIAAQGKNGLLSRDNETQNRITGTNSAIYSKTVGNHYFSAGLYNEIVTFKYNTFGFTGYGITGVLKNEAGITPGSATNDYIPEISGFARRTALLSYFSNFTYGFKEKYYLNAGIRRDGSSRFGKNNRFANFGSVGASWIISSESFMENIKFVSNLKLKASYGTVGNQEGINAFSSRELYTNTTYNGNLGNVLSQLGNPELRWEQKNKFNIGLEYELFKGKIAGGIEYYDDITTNLFLNYQLSRTTGSSSQNRNIGEMENKGLELFLNTVNIRKGKFEWTTNINFTYNANTIKKLSPDTPKDGLVSGEVITKEGLPLGAYYLMEYAGVNPENGNAQYKKIDGTLTEAYSPSERKAFGSGIAPYFGGFTNTVRYGGLEASAFFTYAFGNYIYNLALADLLDPTYYADNVAKDLLTEWKKPGDVTNVPRPSQSMQRNVTRFLEKGDFLRLRNVTLSYTFPSAMSQKVKIKTAKVFIQGQNIFTATKFRGYDPELAGTLVGAQYPVLKQITAGVNVVF